MKSSNCSIGANGEDVAARFLINNDYSILFRNFRIKKFGEIDIIAENETFICFVEVKTRKNSMYGLPSEAVNLQKQRKIKMLAQMFVQKYRIFDRNMRFDIVEIIAIMDESGMCVENINLLKNAF